MHVMKCDFIKDLKKIYAQTDPKINAAILGPSASYPFDLFFKLGRHIVYKNLADYHTNQIILSLNSSGSNSAVSVESFLADLFIT